MRWRVFAIATGVALMGALVATGILTAQSPSHKATKHPPAQGPSLTVTLSMNGKAQQPGAQETVAAGTRMTFRVQIHGPADVTVHNVYLFLGSAPYGSGPGDQPKGHVRILTHIAGVLPPDQAITANWTASRLFDSSRLDLAVQFDFDFPPQHHAAEQHTLIALKVNPQR